MVESLNRKIRMKDLVSKGVSIGLMRVHNRIYEDRPTQGYQWVTRNISYMYVLG